MQFAALQIGPGLVEIISFLLDPNSRGSVQIVSTNPLVQPQINLGMYTDGPVTTNGTDANLAVATYYLLQQSLGAGNIIFPSAAQFATPESLLQAAESASGITIADHITGTARMGTSIENGVVDGNLRVWNQKFNGCRFKRHSILAGWKHLLRSLCDRIGSRCTLRSSSSARSLRSYSRFLHKRKFNELPLFLSTLNQFCTALSASFYRPVSIPSLSNISRASKMSFAASL